MAAAVSGTSPQQMTAPDQPEPPSHRRDHDADEGQQPSDRASIPAAGACAQDRVSESYVGQQSGGKPHTREVQDETCSSYAVLDGQGSLVCLGDLACDRESELCSLSPGLQSVTRWRPLVSATLETGQSALAARGSRGVGI